MKRLALAATLALLVQTWGATDDFAQRAIMKLEGTWQVVFPEEADQKALLEKLAKDVRLTVKGNTFKVALKDEVYFAGTYKVVETIGKIRKSDATYSGPEHLKGKVLPQLAEWLNADTFQVCFPNPAQKNPTRPTEFSSKNGCTLVIFKRNKR